MVKNLKSWGRLEDLQEFFLSMEENVLQRERA